MTLVLGVSRSEARTAWTTRKMAWVLLRAGMISPEVAPRKVRTSWMPWPTTAPAAAEAGLARP